MCGIGLIISGIRIDLSSLIPDHSPPPPDAGRAVFSVDDLKSAICRRGPDRLGIEKVFCDSKFLRSIGEEETISIFKGPGETTGNKSCLQCCSCRYHGTYYSNGDTDKLENGSGILENIPELHFIGSTLHLRGISAVRQPLVDSYGNILIYNGEVFGGIPIGFSSNDGEILMQSLETCYSCDSSGSRSLCDCSLRGKNCVLQLLSTIKGPWAIVYWQNSSKTLWFGRDAFGRRSLLVHWPTLEDSRLLLSSVSPTSFDNKGTESDVESDVSILTFWEELPCGVYSICFSCSQYERCITGKVRKHEWTSSLLKELIRWERNSVEPKPGELQSHTKLAGSDSFPAQGVLSALRESVRRRSVLNPNFQAVSHKVQQDPCVPIAVLFSGGLDSMVLAALLDECLEHCYGIDLLNVSFDGDSAPDRISAKAGIAELKRLAPSRRWTLVEIDADLSKLTWETERVMSLIAPAQTYMDLNIGVALWLAAGGDGLVYEGASNEVEGHRSVKKYKSESKILLVGSGADEQCAGYGRHKTKFRQGGWNALYEEMRLDVQRIWKRNLGRDDRCISDNGKEARFPFLDEDVIRILLDIPLWKVADLSQPSGAGDKKILREVAQMLGLHEAAGLPKRAIQLDLKNAFLHGNLEEEVYMEQPSSFVAQGETEKFGSRIARESNRKNFGSNRAANQASAGSAVVLKPSR